MKKPSILIFIEYYLPGYKSGGPVRSVANLVTLLKDRYELFIVTRDRDYQDQTAYAGLAVNEWITGDGCRLMYLSPPTITLFYIDKLLMQVNADFVYANSLLGELTRLVLALTVARRKLLIIAPRGELHKGALQLKAYKKLPYVYLINTIAKKRIIWHATDLAEMQAIKQFFSESDVHVAPVRFAPDTPKHLTQRTSHTRQAGTVKLIFVSRITPKKGLLPLLNLLKRFPATGRLVLDMYGPVESPSYWQACQACLAQLPTNCVVTYKGVLHHDSVSRVLSAYDFFVLPTFGENFGHAIFEALSVGLPVLISDQTPWRDLDQTGAGWALPLEDEEAWLLALRQCLTMSAGDYTRMTVTARKIADDYLNSVEFEQAYANLFSN